MTQDTLSFESLRRFAEQLQGDANAAKTPPAQLAQKFEQALQTCDVVSFDIFDTLLVREAQIPMEVFLHLEKHPVFKSHAPWPQPLWKLRVDAESWCRRNLPSATIAGEPNLLEIYTRLCELAKLPAELAAAMASAEEQIELQLCRPSPPIQLLHERALAANKKVVYVSDTYHRKDFLRKLLEANGYKTRHDPIFASCDIRASKQTGLLLTKVIQSLGVSASGIVHVGDDTIGDYEKPRAVGMNAILHSHRASALQSAPSYSPQSAILQSFIRGICRIEANCRQPPRDFWWLLGHNAFGPAIAGFCVWLERKFREGAIDRAWFLLRDGAIFHRVFQILFPQRASSMSLRMLPSSRRAFVMPLLLDEKFARWAMMSLLTSSRPHPAREYFARLNLPVEQFTDEFTAAGFHSPDELVITHPEMDKRLFDLAQRTQVSEALTHQSRLEAEMLSQFLLQEGLTGEGRIALIDLGWRGSVQRAISRLLGRSGNSPDIRGYYFATRSPYASELNVQSFLMHASQPEEVSRVMCAELMEIACSTTEGSLIGFERHDDQVRPVFAESQIPLEQKQWITSLHEGIADFAQRLAKVIHEYASVDLPPTAWSEGLLRLLANPTTAEAERIGALTHEDGTGWHTRAPLARFTSATDPDSLWQDYQNAYWRQGLMSQSNAQSAGLRYLVWRMRHLE